MGISPNQTIFDLAVIGNGVAAQAFLWNLSNKESKSQNFSIAHIYSEKIAPACSLRSSATVSLNGIDEDVSPLGNDMREAFFLFDELYKTHAPAGVEEVKRVVVGTNEGEIKKLLRRYKTLESVDHPKIQGLYQGKIYNSYLITPEAFMRWLEKEIKLKKENFPFFAQNIEKRDEVYAVKLEGGGEVLAKKILFATGAFAKIFERFHGDENLEENNVIKAGSFLSREINLNEKSFYLSIDGHLVLYRHNEHEKKLILGNATTIGAYEASDVKALHDLFLKMQGLLTFDLGNFSDYEVTTGLRHKGPKRMILAHELNAEKTLFRINGLYKNGYTMSFLAAERMRQLIF